jgi:phosphoglycerate dehydrogenase-like enzyme
VTTAAGGSAAGAPGRIAVLVTFPAPMSVEHRQVLTAVSERLDIEVVPYGEAVEVRSRRAARPPLADLRGLVPPPSPELVAALGRAEVLLGFDVPVGVDELAPRLRWHQAIGAGVDHLYGAGFGPDVVVTNAAGVAAAPIAEFVMGRLLAVWKRFDELAALQARHEWRPTFGRLMAGSTLGVVGFGAIGQAARAAAFGMHVLAVRRRPGQDPAPADEVFGPDRLPEVLARSDAVVVCAPATPDTRDLFGAAAFAAMREGAVFCNVARGSLVDEEALADALRRGHLGAAILDVARAEPLAADSPLWDVPRLYISPHSAASLDRYMELLLELFADNLGRYARGEPLRNVVDLPAG